MNNRHSSVSANLKLTVVIQQGWIVDESPGRNSTHQATAKALPENPDIAGIIPKKTLIRLRARSYDFSSGLPPLTVGQVVTIEVRPTPAKKAKGKKPAVYYYLLPRFGMNGRPQPAVLVANENRMGQSRATTPRTCPPARPITVRTPKARPVRGKYK